MFEGNIKGVEVVVVVTVVTGTEVVSLVIFLLKFKLRLKYFNTYPSTANRSQISHGPTRPGQLRPRVGKVVDWPCIPFRARCSFTQPRSHSSQYLDRPTARRL